MSFSHHDEKAILPTHSNNTRPATPPLIQPSSNRQHMLPERLRNEIIAFLGEFIGTFMFLFMAYAGTQIAVNSTSSNSTPSTSAIPPPDVSKLLYISFAFGMSLAVNVWVFYRVSGGMFNPAVTLALTLVGAVPPLRALSVFLAQVLASMCSAGVVAAILPGQLAVSTTLGGGVNKAQGFFLEMFLTSQLVIVICMMAVEKHRATFIAPLTIGLALFICEMAGVYYTGGSLNPARSFGPCVVAGFQGYHWIYWLGPAMGACLAAGVYKLCKWMRYETANPGQDHDGFDIEGHRLGSSG